jgi:hypothetical protein
VRILGIRFAFRRRRGEAAHERLHFAALLLILLFNYLYGVELQVFLMIFRAAEPLFIKPG